MVSLSPDRGKSPAWKQHRSPDREAVAGKPLTQSTAASSCHTSCTLTYTHAHVLPGSKLLRLCFLGRRWGVGHKQSLGGQEGWG